MNQYQRVGKDADAFSAFLEDIVGLTSTWFRDAVVEQITKWCEAWVEECEALVRKWVRYPKTPDIISFFIVNFFLFSAFTVSATTLSIPSFIMKLF